MSRARVERKLMANADRLRALRDELAVAQEQLAQLVDEADDARLRSLVSETPLADREHREASKHRSSMTRHRDEVAARIQALEAEQDRLLDQLATERR